MVQGKPVYPGKQSRKRMGVWAEEGTNSGVGTPGRESKRRCLGDRGPPASWSLAAVSCMWEELAAGTVEEQAQGVRVLGF